MFPSPLLQQLIQSLCALAGVDDAFGHGDAGLDQLIPQLCGLRHVEAESADRVIVMNDGQVAMDGAPHDVFAQVDRLHELGLAAPDTVELLHLLREAGIDVPLTGLTVDECADTICRAFGGAEGK